MLPLTPGSLTRADAARFLQRATFGGRPGEDTALIDDGADAWFADQFARTPPETILERRRRKDVSMLRSYWEGVLDGSDQLRKRVAYALSQIFVVSGAELGQNDIAVYADLLEAEAFGTYRDLLEQITLSRSMGRYLTYSGNRRANPRRGTVPDENYAREIMQLFSIGLWELNPDGTQQLSGGVPIPTYDNDDIIGLARVFTGWREADDDSEDRFTRPMVMVERDHESGTKTFLGVTVPENTDGTETLRIALDTLAAHPNVAPFVSKQLIQRLVTSNPTPAYVGRVSSVFTDDGSGQRGNLAAVVRAILVDDEAWQATPPASFGKLREPVLRFTVVMRALGIGTPDGVWRFEALENPATELGQQPYLSPSVFNFYRPGYVPPQTPLGDDGHVAPEFQIANEPSVIGWVNFLSGTLRRSNADTTYAIDDLRALIEDAPALVTEVAARLCPNGLAPALRPIVERTVSAVDHHNPTVRTQERVMSAVLLIAASTDFLYER